MTLFFDTKVQFLDSDAVSTECSWHASHPLFAVASFHQDRGACVTIFDDSGEPLRDITYPVHSTAQATALCWHPDRRQLVAGWENGELNTWCAGYVEFMSIGGTHKSPIVFIGFSEQGGRMVTADSMGLVIGWRCDSHNGQFSIVFTHDLRDPVLNITFRRSVKNVFVSEMSNLAKAAVEGDETALDTLTNWRPRTAARGFTHAGVKDNQCFYVGCQSGVIHYITQSGSCNEVLHNDFAPITQILWHPKREVIVTLMEDMTVGHYMVESSGSLTELERVKLSGRIPGQNGAISWAGNALAIITGDFSVRIWDIDTSDNFLLPMKKPTASNTNKSSLKDSKQSILSRDNDNDTIDGSTMKTKTTEVFTCIAYCSSNQTLCAGTNQGRLYTWRKTTTMCATELLSEYPENAWQLNNVSSVRGAIKHCFWGICEINQSCAMVNCIANVYILKEQPLLRAHSRDLWITQKTANQLTIEHSSNKSMILNSDLSAITDLCLNDRYLVVTNKRSVIVYKITIQDSHSNPITIKQMNTFKDIDCISLFIWNETIIMVGQENVKFYSLGGVVLREIFSNDMEGNLIGASQSHHYLTIFTLNGFIKIYDVARHEPKLLYQPKSCYDLFGNFGEVIMAKCNATASHVAVTIATEMLMPDGKLHIWNIERDSVCEYDFMNKNERNINENIKNNLIGAMPAFANVSRLPTNFSWDAVDGRFIVCETRQVPQAFEKRPPTSMSTMRRLSSFQETSKSPKHSSSIQKEQSHIQAVIFFVKNDSKCDIKEVETLNLIAGEQIVNFWAPFVITLKLGRIERHAMTNFKGIESCNEDTRKLILDFSLFIADGKMDEAFLCIRSIQSNAVWENLARMCVRTGRLDVAKVCLGHLNKAISVRALRLAMANETLEPEAKVAILAIELNMIDEAEMLYQQCGRYDLLNELLQASGRFSEALQIAERHDRVHLKNTYFQYAEWLKESGDVNHALIYYDKSNNSEHNITQMLINDPVLLKQYMTDTTDPNMLKWWAQYIESTGDMDGAMKIYQKAEDWFSQVRILCFLGELLKADSIARQSGDKAACYHLARHYENIGKISDAIQFYTKAQTYSNAVRICKENDLQNDLWTVANAARAKDKAVAAVYFEEMGDFKRAVELYHRSGMLHKAVDMAFASKQPETLQVIAAELDENSDPELVERCAEFFVESQQPQKSVQLLGTVKKYEKAIEICGAYKVPITETLAELLTPNKDDDSENIRSKILIALGEILQEQGDYHTATKKFTQAGDKMRAMKSLLKSGDTDKIVFFAGMSRQKEVYIMAANYLQSLNWQADGKVLKNIIQFYTKGHAFDLLANFYANCAQVEIDEFHDYEKAIKALQEASRCVTKITTVASSHQHQRVAENLQNACTEVKKVLEIQDALERGDYNNVIAVCRSMLSIAERPPVRVIHLQAILIEALIRTKQYTEALDYLRQLTAKSSDWSYKGLIEKPLIEKLAHECGIEFSVLWNLGRQSVPGNEQPSDDTGEDDIQEEIE